VLEEWERLATTVVDAEFYQQLFVQTTSPLEAWREQIRAALERTTPGAVLLPAACQFLERDLRSDEDFLDWSLHMTLLAECAGHAAVNFYSDSKPSNDAVREGRSPLLDRALDLFADRAVALRQLALRVARRKMMRQSASPRPQALVLADAGKRYVLEQEGVSGFRATHMNGAELRASIGVNDMWLQSPLRVSGSDTPWNVARAFFTRLIMEQRGQRTSIVQKYASSADLLITSLEQDPLVRVLMQAFTAPDKALVVIPEGAITLPDTPRTFHAPWFYMVGPSVRFALSDRDTELWRARVPPGFSVVTTGYLGDTRAISRFETLLPRIWWWLKRHTGGSSREVIPVMLSYEVLADRGLTRLGLPPEVEMFELMDQAITELTSAGYFVLVKARSPNAARMARDRYSHKSVLVTHKVPWQALASLAGCVITRESSIGQEALSLGLPIIVWDPTPFRSSLVDLSADYPGRVAVAHRLCELVPSVEAMHAQIPGASSRHVHRSRSSTHQKEPSTEQQVLRVLAASLTARQVRDARPPNRTV
jgi:hypothetical protein